MISASKIYFRLKSPKILRPKVTKICLKNFCEFPPRNISKWYFGFFFRFQRIWISNLFLTDDTDRFLSHPIYPIVICYIVDTSTKTSSSFRENLCEKKSKENVDKNKVLKTRSSTFIASVLMALSSCCDSIYVKS